MASLLSNFESVSFQDDDLFYRNLLPIKYCKTVFVLGLLLIYSLFHLFFLGGADAGGWEEYFDYIFPEDEGAKPNLKLLAMAKMWKKKKEVEPEPETETSTPEKEMKEESDSGKFCQNSTISKKLNFSAKTSVNRQWYDKRSHGNVILLPKLF